MKISAKKKIIITVSVVSILLAVLVIWVLWANTALECNSLTVKSDRLPKAFDGYRIAHISDLHNSSVCDDVIDILKKAPPDIIAITGDSIDCNHTDIDRAIGFFKEAVKLAPCYYVTGNHEAWIDTDVYEDYENKLVLLGVTVLRNDSVTVSKSGDSITLVGIDDPEFTDVQYSGGIGEELGLPDLNGIRADGFNVLLSHRPEYFEDYAEADYDVVLSGHTHGGQFRLPFVGGIIAHGQGWFPKYDAGIFEKDNTSMIVSRGIGNSKMPVRFNNRPEVIFVTLAK